MVAVKSASICFVVSRCFLFANQRVGGAKEFNIERLGVWKPRVRRAKVSKLSYGLDKRLYNLFVLSIDLTIFNSS